MMEWTVGICYLADMNILCMTTFYPSHVKDKKVAALLLASVRN